MEGRKASEPRVRSEVWIREHGIYDPSGHMKWLEWTTATNAEASVTKAAEASKNHYITKIHASYDRSPTNSNLAVHLEVDGVEKARFYISGQINHIDFSQPFEVPENKSVTAKLDAAGGAGEIGSIVLGGFTLSTTE